MRRLLALVLLLAGCTASPTAPSSPSSASTPSSPSSAAAAASGAAVAEAGSLPCQDSIDGGPPPDGFQVVLGAVALPTGPGYPALPAAGSGLPGGPRLFAKTGLLVRAGTASELVVAERPGNRVGVTWGTPGPEPSVRFTVPACRDRYGTGWLVYPGGYWVDRPLCLPLTVRAGGREQRVLIGIGTACPGQAPPAG